MVLESYSLVTALEQTYVHVAQILLFFSCRKAEFNNEKEAVLGWVYYQCWYIQTHPWSLLCVVTCIRVKILRPKDIIYPKVFAETLKGHMCGLMSFFFWKKQGILCMGVLYTCQAPAFKYSYTVHREKNHNIFFSHSGALCVRDVHAVWEMDLSYIVCTGS